MMASRRENCREYNHRSGKTNARVATVYLSANGNTRENTLHWLRTEGRKRGLPLKKVKTMLNGQAPYYQTFQTRNGTTAVHVIGAEDMGRAVAEKPGSLGVMFLDLLMVFLYARRCAALFACSSEPRDPREILPRTIKAGEELTFSLRGVDLRVRILPFVQDQLPQLALIVPPGRTGDWQGRGQGKGPLRAVCELRYKELARAFLDNVIGRYRLAVVMRKTEGYPAAGKADAVIDIVQKGQSADLNRLRPVLTILKSYPAVVTSHKKAKKKGGVTNG